MTGTIASDDAALTVGAREVAAALTVGTFGLGVLLILPGLLTALAQGYGFDEKQLGLFSLADLGGLTLGSAFGAPLLLRIGIRQGARWGMFVAAAANAVCAVVLASYPLLVLRLVAGFGAGLGVAASYLIVGRSRNVDRNFALYVVSQGLFAAIALKALPYFVQQAGVAGIFQALAALSVVAWVLAHAFPSRRSPQRRTGQVLRVGRAAWTGLAAIAAFFVAQGAVWAYLELIGVRGGVPLSAVSTAVSLSTLVGMAGPLTAAIVGARFGRVLPLIVGTFVALVALAMLSSSLDALRFAVAACLFNIAWNFSIPYQLSALAAVDSTGSVVVWAAPASLAGLAVGPPIAAMALELGGFVGVLWLSAALCMACLGGLTPALFRRGEAVA